VRDLLLLSPLRVSRAGVLPFLGSGVIWPSAKISEIC
jgi:hypothetical protein